MKAEDTVMTDDQVIQVLIDKVVGSTVLHHTATFDKNRDIPLLEAQANATFPKGIDKGRREVLDFLLKYPYETQVSFNNYYRVIKIPKDEWQAQVKVWGKE